MRLIVWLQLILMTQIKLPQETLTTEFPDFDLKLEYLGLNSKWIIQNDYSIIIQISLEIWLWQRYTSWFQSVNVKIYFISDAIPESKNLNWH